MKTQRNIRLVLAALILTSLTAWLLRAQVTLSPPIVTGSNTLRLVVNGPTTNIRYDVYFTNAVASNSASWPLLVTGSLNQVIFDRASTVAGITNQTFSYNTNDCLTTDVYDNNGSTRTIAKTLNSVDNLKHKAILMLVYSAGLRVGEVVKLKPEDIDSKRMLIHIKGAKGRKDGYMILSETALEILREYWREYRPKKWLFSGQNKERYITIRTVEKIFSNACESAKILKLVTVRSFRHSFATHPLEGGTDLQYIKEILRHKSSKTTEIYTHVRTKDIGMIKSPMDSLNLKKGVRGVKICYERGFLAFSQMAV
ncbi:MAG: tyrosine-type recombinase/integrase [Thermodesulforhabdaceae bacterium]